MPATISHKDGSLRDAHRRQTEWALRQAALELFAEQGYDATRTEDVAERAGVSARTFFRYFPSKDTVLFSNHGAWFDSFSETYQKLPQSMSDLDAMCAALRDVAGNFSRRRPSLRLYWEILADSPALLARARECHAQNVLKVATAVAARRGLPERDDTSTLFATISLMTYRRVMNKWLAGGDSADLREAITAEFKLLADTMAQCQRAPGAPAVESRLRAG